MKIVDDFLLLVWMYSTYAYVCHYTCLTCSGSTQYNCLTCSEGLVSPSGQCSCSLSVFQEGLCLNDCSLGYEQQGNYCRKCSGNCKTCLNSVCQSCYDNYKIVDSSFCQPYCPAGSYFLSGNCVNLLSSGQSDIYYYAFNEDKNSCEVMTTDFTFDPTFYTAGNNCKYFNGYLIFGNNNLWHSRKGSLFKSNLQAHSNITIYLKIFFADQWNVGDRFNITLDDQIIYDYQVTNNNWGTYLEQNVKQNVLHSSNNFTLIFNVRNQGGTGYIGLTDLQIIVVKCGCEICDANGCVIEQKVICLSSQIKIEDICTNCDSLPFRLSDCNCMQGYYLEADQCQACQKNCLTCIYSEEYCSSCKLQYQTPPLCDCSNTIMNAVASFSMTTPQIQITFSEDFTLRSLRCKNIFIEQTSQLLGENPLCQHQDKTISVFLGNQFTFTVHDEIQLNENNIILDACETSISTVNLKQIIAEVLTPHLILSKSKLVLSGQSNETIYYYTNQQLNGLQWSIVDFKTDFDVVYDLVNQWNNELTNQQNYFSIKGNSFKEENSFNLEFNFCNFLGICSSVKLEVAILLNFDRFLHIYLEYKKDLIHEQQSLQFTVSGQIQIGDQLMYSNDPLIISYSFSGNEVQIEDEVSINPDSFFIITIDSSLLKKLDTYNLDLQVKNGDLSQSQQMQFLLDEEPILVTIQGGNRIQSYLKQFQLAILKNNEEVYDSNLCETCSPFSLVIWTCMDLASNSECLDQNNNTINLSQNNTILTIEKNQFTPYKVVEFQLNAILNDYIYTHQITVYFVEENLPTLVVSTNHANSISNCYDDIEFEVNYSDKNINSEFLTQKGIIIQDYQIISYFTFNYTTFKIRLSDYYTLKKDKVLLYRFSIYNPNFIIPSLYSIPFRFNSPPQSCQIKITSLKQLYLLTVDDCIDSDIPLQYRFSVYLKNPEYPFYQANTNNRIQLSDYGYNNSLTTNLIGDQVILGVEVKDIFNGINNFITQFQVNQMNSSYSLEEFDDTNKVYQMSYYLQYYANVINESQLQNLTTFQKQINISQITNLEIYHLNELLIGLDSALQFEYWETSIEQLKTDITNFLDVKNQNSYFQQLVIDQRIFYLFQSFSYGIQQYMGKSQNNSRRLLINESTPELIINHINEVSNQQLLTQLPNGQQLTKYTDFFNVSTTKFTNNYVNTSEINITVSPNTYIYESKIKFKDNIFKTEMELNYIRNSSYPLYNIQLQSSNSTDEMREINGTLLYEFDVDDENQQYQCAIKTDEGWDMDECKSTKKNYKVICECTKVGSTTIVQVFINFKQNIMNLFAQSNFDRISNYNYFVAVFTYIEIIFAMVFFWYLYFGNKLDVHQKEIKNKTPSPSKVFPQNLPYDKQTSLKASNYSPRNEIKIMEIDEPLDNKSEQNNAPSDKMEQIYSCDNAISSPKSIDNIMFPSSEKTLQTINKTAQFQEFDEEKDKLARFLLFYKNYHKILALYYRYDEKSSRPVRLTLLYLSILGQMGIVNWFGNVFDVFLMLLLSLFTYVFGLLFKKVLAFFLRNKFFILQQIGNFFAFTLAIFFIFVTLSSIPLYGNTLACNLWALGFITGIILDFLVYTTVQIALMYSVMKLFGKQNFFRVFCLLILRELQKKSQTRCVTRLFFQINH